MKILLASDEKTSLTESIQTYLTEKGHEVIVWGHLADESQKWRWADIGREAGEMVSTGDADQAVILCWSGTGVCMAANKVEGIRAALCWDAETASLARKWDDANVLCMSLRYTSETLATEMLDSWFSTNFDEEGLDQAHKVK